MLKIKESRIGERIFLLEFRTQYELASTFLRFQEHYESKVFRGKVFSLEDYMDWYAKTFKDFTYYQDWSGFNVPSTTFKPFYEGKFDPLLRKEKQILDRFRKEKQAFYVIGLSRRRKLVDPSTLKHEIAHGLFHCREEYRSEVLSCLKQYETRALRRRLTALGYCRQVLDDEVHAYVLTDVKPLLGRLPRRLAPLKRELQEIFRAHSAEAAIRWPPLPAR